MCVCLVQLNCVRVQVKVHIVKWGCAVGCIKYTVNERTFQKANNSLQTFFFIGLMKYSNLLKLEIYEVF